MDKKTLSERVVECLTSRKEELGFTNARISELSGVPESTVTKLFNGTIKSPTLETLVPVAKILNLQINSLLELGEEDGGTDPSSAKSGGDKFFVMLINNYEKQLKNKDRWIIGLASLIFVLVGVLVVFVLYDITHPHMGWIQYTAYFQEKIGILKDIFHL